jgi:hypothetical protein
MNEEKRQIIKSYLEQLNVIYACILDCEWDTDKQLEVIKKCYDRYSTGLFQQVLDTGVIYEPYTFQIFPFDSLDEAIQFYTESVNVDMSVWDHFSLITDNSGDTNV